MRIFCGDFNHLTGLMNPKQVYLRRKEKEHLAAEAQAYHVRNEVFMRSVLTRIRLRLVAIWGLIAGNALFTMTCVFPFTLKHNYSPIQLYILIMLSALMFIASIALIDKDKSKDSENSLIIRFLSAITFVLGATIVAAIIEGCIFFLIWHL